MKSDSEEFCKNSFDKYLKKIMFSSTILWNEVEQKDEPPDFHLSVDGMMYAVEVTILMQKVDVGTENHLPAGVVRDLLRKFVVDDVQAVARANSWLHGTYRVSFSKPITNFTNHKDLIQSGLLAYISSTQGASKAPPKVVYKHNRQRCLIEKVNSEENKVVMGGPYISRRGYEALVEVKQLLDNRLDEKQYRLRNIAHPKILLLHDKYYFADVEAYKGCISTAPSLQSFHTVFIVGSTIEGEVLYSQDLTWIQNV